MVALQFSNRRCAYRRTVSPANDACNVFLFCLTGQRLSTCHITTYSLNRPWNAGCIAVGESVSVIISCLDILLCAVQRTITIAVAASFDVCVSVTLDT